MLRYLTHPQVRVSADVPVPRWGLSDDGRARATLLCNRPWWATTTRLVSSDETKALETAAIVAAHTGLTIEVRARLHENDRSATGFVPPDRFEQLADEFFASPDRSVDGWESALHAQRRVVDGTADLLADGDGDVAVCGHGAVGTLLLCHLLQLPISRAEDQNGPGAAPGGGNVWAFDRRTRRVVHRWRPFDSSAS